VLLEEISAKLKDLPPAVGGSDCADPNCVDPDCAEPEAEEPVVLIEGTRIVKKVWPPEVDDFGSGCGDHGHGHGAGSCSSKGGCSSGGSCSSTAKEDCDKWTLDIKPPAEGERWSVTLDPHNPETCGEDHGSCSSHGHAHGADGACDHHGHGHGSGGEVSADDPQLTEEAKQWMIDHPDEKLPLHLCPTEGDCNKCPERHDCKWHSKDGKVTDIEDMLG